MQFEVNLGRSCRFEVLDVDGQCNAGFDPRSCFVMGEAAGTAAALLTEQGLCCTCNMNIDELQKQLVRQGAWLGDEVHAKQGEK